MPEYLPEKKGEGTSSFDKAHAEFMAALDEESRLMSQIDEVLKTAEDRTAAERLVLDQYAPLVDAAIRRSSDALKAWLYALRGESSKLDSSG